ncbi:MAG: TIGR02466 family protein [Bdellovibrionia bacterium]
MIKTLFASNLYVSNLESKQNKNLNSDLLDEAYKFAELDERGQDWSSKNYPGGYTSYGSLTNMWELSSTFEILKNELDKHVRKFAKSLEYDINPRDLQIVSLWINIMPPQVTHSWHIHPHSVISGTYYVRTPKNCSAIKFEDPRISRFMNTPVRKKTAAPERQWHYHHSPKAGEVVLFESWMNHEVPPNPARSERVSISFNYDWIRR